MKKYLLYEDNAFLFNKLYNGNITEYFKLFGDSIIAEGCIDDAPEGARLFSLMMGHVEDNIFILDYVGFDEEREVDGKDGLVLSYLDDIIASGLIETIYVVMDDDSQLDLYESIGFNISYDEGKFTYETNIKDIIELPKSKYSENICTLKELSNRAKKKLEKKLSLESTTSVGIKVPFDIDEYMPESCAFVKDDEVKAIIFLKEEYKSINIAYVYAEDKGAMLIPTVATVREKVLEKYPEDYKITVASLNNNSAKLIEKMFPEYSKKTLYEGVKHITISDIFDAIEYSSVE